MFKFFYGSGCFGIVLFIYTIITWVINLINFLNCDFVEPFKEEVILGLGVLFPPVTWVTVWMDISPVVTL
jgi:hypothetical protein